jgi:hypothetical protein
MSSRQTTNRDEGRAVAQPGLRNLCYLVFDGHKLVAAFARRDDAVHWLEECGHPAMDLRRISAFDAPLPSRVAQPGKSGEKTGAGLARRR